jgi:HK97 family phage portal protein
LLLSNGTFAPTAYGDAAPSFANQYFYSGTGLNLTDAFASYGAVYRSQIWVSTLVNKIAYGTARLPLKVYQRGADDDRSEQRDSPLAKLLRNPNSRHDPFFFWLWTVSTQELYGEAMWIKIRPRPGAAPTQLWPMHPANVMTHRDKETGALKYRYLWGAVENGFLEWDSADVVHFKTYNPDDQVRGLSRLEPLRQTILNEDSARRASAAMWSNGGRPSMALTAPKSLSEQAFKRLEANVRGLHQGVDNWGKIAILEEGLTPTLLPLNAETMQYIEARHINREEACGIFDVPPPVVHILDRATFSNITEQMRSMYRDTMAPRLKLYESVLDSQLRPDFDPQGALYAEFLMDEVLRGDFETRQAALAAASHMTIAEKRRIENLPFIEGTDRIFLNSAEVPMPVPQSGDAPAAPAFQQVGLPALIEAGVITRDDARRLLGIDGQAPPPPPVEDPATPPPVKCLSCGIEEKASERGLCRSCEGKAGRMLTARKEIEA